MGLTGLDECFGSVYKVVRLPGDKGINITCTLLKFDENNFYGAIFGEVGLTSSTQMTSTDSLEMVERDDEHAAIVSDRVRSILENFRLEEIASKCGMEVCYFNMEEFLKGGGLLSCMVLNVNYQSYKTRLL